MAGPLDLEWLPVLYSHCQYLEWKGVEKTSSDPGDLSEKQEIKRERGERDYRQRVLGYDRN